MATRSSIVIEKADGSLEPFIADKLRNSLRKAGANAKSVDNITAHVEQELRSGMKSAEIYKHAFEILRKSEMIAASRYSMKRAVFELGPTGFPFEDFLGEIFRAKGWEVLTRQLLRGTCVTHEVDLVAKHSDVVVGGEAKFHNDLGIKTDVKVALYVQSRFQDIKDKQLAQFGGKSISEYWLLTNTKFTSEAIEYGRCVGLTLISWNYPAQGNLQSLIEETAIFPVTALSVVPRADRMKLVKEGLVLCRDILRRPERLVEIGFTANKASVILGEARSLCNISHAVE